MTKAEDKIEDIKEIIETSAEAPAKAKKVAAQKMYKVRVDSDETAEGKSDVFIALNFHSYLIKRDQEVIVPEGVVEILRNTVANTIDGNKNPAKVHRFNFNAEPV